MIDRRKPDFTNTPVAASRPRMELRLRESIEEPAVSIVTPFFNTGAIFHETAQSIMQQTLQQWEWLIINDASTDPESLTVLDCYRGRDPRIRVIDLEQNSGPSGARNAGFQQARAEYVAQVDSDDLLEPTALEKWAWCLVSYPDYAFVKGYSVGFDKQNYLWTQAFTEGRALLETNPIDLNCMMRKSVHQHVGGYSEEIRGGFEDWDFWLRSADHGYWGHTIPEYLNWYRRRENHSDRWTEWSSEGHKRFIKHASARYPRLWEQGVKAIPARPHLPNASIATDLPFRNRLDTGRPALLLVLPWLTMGGADKFNLDLLKLLVHRYGYHVTIATTMPGNHEWMASFAEHTPDIFALSHFLHATDFPRFLNYLIQSRGTQTVLVSNSELGYALTPFLRAYNPDTVFMDYIHMEEEYWKNGGYPQRSVEYQNQLDYTVVSSQHLKDWMVARGGDASRIEVCYTNIDANTWSPNSSVRERTRQELGIADSTSVLLYAGRIVEQKQPRVFAETIAHLSRRNLDFVALVAGEGGDLAWLQSFVTEHNIAHHVQFLGAVSNDRIKELLNAADIFFLPSKMEGISLAIYEAMSMGVVPVGANVGGQRELVIPSCGILIERSNPTTEAQEYAAHLDTLIRDTERTRRMGAMCRERILAEFRLDSMGEQMMCCLAHARAMADHNPRQSIDLKLANTLAANAIESVRSEQVLEYLWHQHYSGKTHFNNQSPQFLEQITKRHVLQWFAHRVRRYVRRKAQ